jgi:transposase
VTFLLAQIQGRWFYLYLILDLYTPPSGQIFAALRDDKGLEQLMSELRQLAPALVVLEATVRFAVTLAGALASLGLPLATVNPRQIRDFAGADLLQ